MIVGEYQPTDSQVLVWNGVERCGLVLRHLATHSYIVVETTNGSQEPEKSYDIDAHDVDAVVRQYAHHTITGIWHSHPPGPENAEPSAFDKEWHPAFLDMFLSHEFRWHRWQYEVNDYREKELPWTA